MALDREMTLKEMHKTLKRSFPIKEIKALQEEGSRRVLQAVLQRTIREERKNAVS
jgi:hypothetical protein